MARKKLLSRNEIQSFRYSWFHLKMRENEGILVACICLPIYYIQGDIPTPCITTSKEVWNANNTFSSSLRNPEDRLESTGVDDRLAQTWKHLLKLVPTQQPLHLYY